MTGDLEYQIEKDNSKKSVLITILAFLVFLVILFINQGGIEMIFGRKNISSANWGIDWFIFVGFVILCILSIFYLRFKPWKYPFRSKWDRNGITLGYPNGKVKQFYWKDIAEIKLEGENWVKMLVPYYYGGRFSWNSLLWMVYAGVTKPVWSVNFAFFHFRLKNNKIISVPIQKENLQKALDIIKSSNPVQKEVENFSETKTKWWLIGLLISLPLILGISISFQSIKNQPLNLIGIGIFALIPIIFLIFIIKSFKKRRALLGGMVVEGLPSIMLNLFYLIIDVVLFAFVGFLLSLSAGGIHGSPQYDYSNVTFTNRTIVTNNFTLLPSDFVVLRKDSLNSKNYGNNWCSNPSLNQRDTLEIWIKENPILAPYIKNTYYNVVLNEQSPNSIPGFSLNFQGTSYSNQFMLQEGIQANHANNITLCFYINDTISNIISNQICLTPFEIPAEC